MRVIVVGAGEVGTHVARELSARRVEVVLVDRLASALANAEESIDALTVTGDGCHWSVLRRAEAKRADLVVAVTGSDEANMVIAALARTEGAARSIARVDAAGFYRTRDSVEAGVLGIDSLLCASRLVTLELRRLLQARRSRFVVHFAANRMAACTVAIDDGSALRGQSAAHLKNPGGKLVRGVVRDGVLRPPEEIARLEVSDELLVAGRPSEIAIAHDQLQDTLGTRRAILVGGGDVGAQLATALTRTERRVEVIEHDPVRCEQLAEQLRGVHVIHGDGTSIALLRDLQVGSAEHLLAVTRSDEANLMVSLLATNLGVGSAYAVVHRHGYADVYGHLGVHGTAGPHEVIARNVIGLLPHEGVLTRQRIPDCSHELVELPVAHPESGKALAVDDITLPPSCLLVGVSDANGVYTPAAGLALGHDARLLVAQPPHAHAEVLKRLKQRRGAS